MLKILLADDENIELQYLKSIFTKEPCRDKFKVVATASDGIETVQMAKKFNPNIVITDIKMPGIDGIEAACQIKTINPNVIIILNTAYAEFEFAKRALENSFDAYILKPADAKEIMRVLDECLEKRNISPAFAESEGENGSIEEAKKYIEKNLGGNLNLSDIASHVHFSPTYFSKIFKENEGVTLSKYINGQRIEAAKNYIMNSDMTIREICCLCGFSNISNFNRVFRQHTGKMPSQLRKEK